MARAPRAGGGTVPVRSPAPPRPHTLRRSLNRYVRRPSGRPPRTRPRGVACVVWLAPSKHVGDRGASMVPVAISRWCRGARRRGRARHCQSRCTCACHVTSMRSRNRGVHSERRELFQGASADLLMARTPFLYASTASWSRLDSSIFLGPGRGGGWAGGGGDGGSVPHRQRGRTGDESKHAGVLGPDCRQPQRRCRLHERGNVRATRAGRRRGGGGGRVGGAPLGARPSRRSSRAFCR